MGVKIVYTICGLAVMSSIMLATSIFFPMHKLTFFALGLKKVAQMHTHVVWITFPVGNQGFCDSVFSTAEDASRKSGDRLSKIKERRAKSGKFCGNLEGTHDVQDVAMNLCAPAIAMFWPSFCTGVNNAYFLGVFMVVCMVFGILLQGLACFFLYDYSARKANPQYRMIGGICLGVSPLLLTTSLGAYYYAVLHELSTVGTGALRFLFGTSSADGTSLAFIFCCVAVIIQLGQLCLFPMTARDYLEEEYLDNKAAKQEALEYGTFGGSPQQSLLSQQQQQGQLQPLQPAGAFPTMMVTGPMQPASFTIQPATAW